MTTFQIQCLLGYLGYLDRLEQDGISGPKTKNALRRFQADYGLPQSGAPDEATGKLLLDAVAGRAEKVARPVDTGTWWDNIKYFKPDEENICCPCPRCVGKREYPTEALMRKADSIREELGPMVVSSCRRCQEHNDELSGSAKNSRHIIGKAMDFNAPKSTPEQIEACLARRKAAGEIRYWYRMSSGWYHFDIE